MTPDLDRTRRGGGVGGIQTVIYKYAEAFPRHGIELIPHPKTNEPISYDIHAVHAGSANFRSPRGVNVAILHGLYWTGEASMHRSHYLSNRRIIESIRTSRAVTVPSEWVAEVIRREFHIDPFIVPHGVDVDEWETEEPVEGSYVLWAKNRTDDVCSPKEIVSIARDMPDVEFHMTFGAPSPNSTVFNRALSPEEMRNEILNCGVYASTPPETFGIATLEAMAAGKPVVTFRRGNWQLVRHGVTGYVARDGDLVDFQNGIRWCLENKARLGKNAKYEAKKYTWDAAVEELIKAFHYAADMSNETGVTFVIPAFNKQDTLPRAVESALNQSLPGHRVNVVIVNDGSTDDTKKVGEKLASHENVRIVNLKERGGVANARNVGAAQAYNGHLLAFLDADDALADGWLTATAKKLMYSNANGVAYTRLMTASDGKVQAWPREFSYDDQASGKNKVPTCALVRREAWKRAGGYRSRYNRYADVGCGSEDAAFWLDIARLGWSIDLATEKPLFIYNDGVGGTSKPGYTEVPWSDFYPNHKLPSPVSDERVSRPAYTYTPYEVSVIIPVGPGHEKYLHDAVDSVIAQTYRKIEIIVVWDSQEKIPVWYTGGYPFVKFIKTKGGLGSGAARNLGLEAASAKSVVFLDADDMIKSKFVSQCVSVWNREKKIVYTDYIAAQKLGDLKYQNVVGAFGYDAPSDTVYVRGRLRDYTRELAMRQPVIDEDGMWCPPVTCLYPRRWLEEVGGFNESLPTWEDWDLHIRLVKAGHDYVCLHEHLLFYRLYSGKRRNEAYESREEMLDTLRKIIND